MYSGEGGIPSSIFGLLGGCRLGVEPLVYATLNLPRMQRISMGQVFSKDVDTTHQLSLAKNVTLPLAIKVGGGRWVEEMGVGVERRGICNVNGYEVIVSISGNRVLHMQSPCHPPVPIKQFHVTTFTTGVVPTSNC